MDINEMMANNSNVEIQKSSLALGVRVPRSVDSPISFLMGLRDYTSTTTDIKRRIELCNHLYRDEGTVGAAVDILVEFAVTQIWAEDTGNKKLNKILSYFNDNVNSENSNNLAGLGPIIQQLTLEFFLSGNAFPYCVWEYIDINGIKEPIALPMSTTLLNPKSIIIPENEFAFGKENIYYQSDLLYSGLQKDGRKNRELTPIRKNLSPNLIKKIKESRGGQIQIDPRYVTHIKRKARDYEIWGVPYLTRVFSAMSIIKKLRKLDEATTEGLINLITVFKLGSDEFPAGPDRMQALGNLLSDPAASTMLIWAHDLEIDQVGPDGKVLGFKDKYKEAYDELLRGLGVHPGLMGTDASVNWQDLLAIIVKLQSWRDLAIKWVERIYRQIAVENKFDDIYPKAKMANMNLMDDTAIKNMVLNFYDRGLLDPDTTLREGGYNFDGIVEKKKALTTELTKLFAPPALPFTGNNNSGSQSKPLPKPAKNGPSPIVDLQNKGKRPNKTGK